jgi:hypothetical protein
MTGLLYGGGLGFVLRLGLRPLRHNFIEFGAVVSGVPQLVDVSPEYSI